MNITKNLVEMMHGGIEVESEPGVGSVFTVRLAQKLVAGSGVIGKEVAENLQNFRVNKATQIRTAQVVREYMPYGKVLIVDDAETNLYVATGLLMPYGLTIETAISGFEAVEKIKNGNGYDIIFMDHMMPEMDGIETTKLIRETGYQKPVIALTANAVAGQAEMFLKNGFDDFIPKPIDIRQMNALLKKWIRDKAPREVVEAARREKAASAPVSRKNAAGIDYELLTIFARDTKKTLPVLSATLKNIYSATENEIRLFIVNTHAIKSALANIGEREAARMANLLEKAGREKNMEFIVAETQNFIENLEAIIAKIDSETDTSADTDEDPAYLTDQLQVVYQACTDYDERAAETVLAILAQMSWTKETKTALDQISEHLLFSDFEAAAAKTAEFLARI